MSVKKAVIPCAGLGTRFLPASKVYAKELLPIVDVPALIYILDEAEKSGIEDLLIIISPQKQQIKRLFMPNKPLNTSLLRRGRTDEFRLANRQWSMNISFAVQRRMNGNGNALLLAREFVGDDAFAVLFGDDVMFTEGNAKPVTAQLIDAYDLTGASILGCQRASEAVARRCSVMIEGKQICDGVRRVEGVIEKPDGKLPGNLTSLGRFILTADIFDYIGRTEMRDGEVYLTDAINLMAVEGKEVCSCEFSARRYDIGDKEGYLEAVTEFALRDAKLGEAFKVYLSSLADRNFEP